MGLGNKNTTEKSNEVNGMADWGQDRNHSFRKRDLYQRRAAAISAGGAASGAENSGAPRPAPYKPIPIPDYSQDMQRYYQMTNNSVPAVQRMNPGMIQRGGYQGPTFANDRPQTSLGGGLQMKPQMRGGRGVGGMIRRFMPGRSSGPRPATPGRGYNGSGIGNYGQQNPPQGNITIPRNEFTPGSPSNPLLNMSLDPNAGSTGGINGGGMMGPRPMMIR